MIDPAAIRRSYDKAAQKYAEMRSQESSIPFLEMLNSRLPRNSVIVDLGCGAGLPVDRWLIDHGHRVIGIDISPNMLALARKNVPEALYRRGEMANHECGQYEPHAIVCFFAMFHVDRTLHEPLLHSLHSALRPAGLLLMTTGRTDWEGEEDFMGTRMVWSHFDRATNRHLIEHSGFKIVHEGIHPGNSDGDDDWHPIFLAVKG